MSEFVTKGFHHVTMVTKDAQVNLAFYRDVLGFDLVKRTVNFDLSSTYHLYYGKEKGAPGTLLTFFEWPDAPRGAWGTGSIHHLAFRVADDAVQLDARSRVVRAGGRPTEVIDRFWFHSVYFKEPGGVLFELATDGPGFAVDEDPAHLGEALVLPPWLEGNRREIEAVLPPIALPPAAAS